MKVLLIFPILRDLNNADGIIIKNDGIVNGFKENNIDTDVIYMDSKGVYLNTKPIYRFQDSKQIRRIQYVVSLWKEIVKTINEEYDLIWIRVPMIQPFFTKAISQVRSKITSAKIILEYGAYPYHNELKGFSKIFYWLNRKSELNLHRQADFIITYSGQDFVDGIPNIPIDNGIDFSRIKQVNDHSLGNTINLICVSSVKKWHAYDRIIEGLKNYNTVDIKRNIILHIIGEGPELEKLKYLTQKYNLEGQIIFYGFKSGQELDDIYNQSDCAISTLGFHRIGLANSSSLKNREYVARGLPIVLSTPDKDMPPSDNFFKYVESNDEPLDIDDIINFIEKQYSSYSNLNSQIRDYGKERASWTNKIKTVIQYISKD